MTPRSSTSGPLLARGVEVRIGTRTILHSMDFLLHPGELCGLIGPSGAGKSTLIKVLLGLRRPAAGRVTLGGQGVGSQGPVGYVPQDDAVHRGLTVRQALTFAARLRLYRVDAQAQSQRVAQVAGQVGLGERMDVRIRSLSGGQRKRVSVALELLTQPALLILDEPTSGLDPGLEARMMALFSQVARGADAGTGGRVVMVATHAMQSLERCQALAVLVQGRLAYFGPPDRALGYFKAERMADIFRRLDLRKPPVWAKVWARSPIRTEFMGRPAPALGTTARPPLPVEQQSGPAPRDPRSSADPPGASKPSAQEQLAALKARLGKESP